MASRVRLEVSYAQLAVFARNLSQPFNDWTDQHVAQGFAWRPGSVSFRTMSETGTHLVDIAVVDHLNAVDPDTVRAIEVPFAVSSDGEIEIGSIAETVPLTLPAGGYVLRCEFLRSLDGDGDRVRLIFARLDAPRFAVVRADQELALSGELLTTAEPARSGLCSP